MGVLKKMIAGKKYPQCFKALKMIAEIMLEVVFEKNPQVESQLQLTNHLEANSKKVKRPNSGSIAW